MTNPERKAVQCAGGQRTNRRRDPARAGDEHRAACPPPVRFPVDVEEPVGRPLFRLQRIAYEENVKSRFALLREEVKGKFFQIN